MRKELPELLPPNLACRLVLTQRTELGVPQMIFKVMMPVPARVTKPRAHFLVSGAALAVTVAGGTASFEVAAILDHEVVVLE